MIAVEVSWADAITAIATAVIALGVGAAAWAAWSAREQVRELRVSRQATVMIEVSRRWDDDQMVETRSMLAHYHGNGDRLASAMPQFRAAVANTEDPRYIKLMREPNFFEDLAILVERGALDFDAVVQGWGGSLVERWQLWEPTVQWIREREADGGPGVSFECFERLAKRIEESET